MLLRCILFLSVINLSPISLGQLPLHRLNYSFINPAMTLEPFYSDHFNLNTTYDFTQQSSTIYANGSMNLSRFSASLNFVGHTGTTDQYHQIHFQMAKHFSGDCRPGAYEFLSFGTAMGYIHYSRGERKYTIPNLDIGMAFMKGLHLFGISTSNTGMIFHDHPRLLPTIHFHGDYAFKINRKAFLSFPARLSLDRSKQYIQAGVQYKRLRKHHLALLFDSNQQLSILAGHSFYVNRKRSYGRRHIQLGLNSGYLLEQKNMQVGVQCSLSI